MSFKAGPNLGLVVDGPQGSTHYNELMARWRGLDALVQCVVLDIEDTPPGSPTDGALYIVAPGGSGDWSGKDGALARWSEDAGDAGAWEFYEPRAGWAAFNVAAGQVWRFASGGWLPAGSSPVDTETGGALEASAFNAGRYTRFTHAAPSYEFSGAAGLVVGAEYYGRYAGAGVLTIAGTDGLTVNPPAGGTLTVPPGGTFTVKIVAADEADLWGDTVPASE